MLDIKFIRENKDVVIAGAKKKLVKIDIDELLKIDDKRLALLSEVETLRAKQNSVSDRMSQLTDPSEKAELIKSMQVHKEDLKAKEEELKAIMETWRDLMLRVPNVPDPSVADGNSEYPQ
jgi:seryl-tRNA synthetase